MATEESSNVERSIGRVEGKMDLMIGQITELSTAFKALESGRLNRLELQFANLQGRIAIISAGASVLISILLFVGEKIFFPSK